MAGPDYLFTSLNLSSFVFDLNFEGTLQFDLSTSRESVLINQKAHAALAALDKLLVDYFKNIISTFWKELGEEDLSFLFSEVINRHISVQRLTNLGGFFRLSPALELINMLHQYVKFECIVNKISKKLTWNEIVASGKTLILCHPKTLESQRDERLSALDSLLPDTIFLVGSPIEPFPIQLLSRSTQELAIVILSKYNLAYTVLKPYDVKAFKNGTELRKGCILQPFITDGPRYISINIAKFKFHSVMTGEFFRLNAIHPFISKLIEYGGNFPEGSAEWWEFIRFIQEFRSIDEKINDSELNWIRARQLSILGKMLTAGKISQEDINSLMIQIDDFPEWERPKLV